MATPTTVTTTIRWRETSADARHVLTHLADLSGEDRTYIAAALLRLLSAAEPQSVGPISLTWDGNVGQVVATLDHPFKQGG